MAKSKSKSAPRSKDRSDLRPAKSAVVIVYSRPSGYWYAQARDAKAGSRIADASAHSREGALHELRGKFAMIGVAIKSITDEDPYATGAAHATKRKYGPKASEKIGRTMREFKLGKLKSGSGRKVTSREQAIAIGIAQARSRGYKAPPASAHATMDLDARVRAYVSKMRPGAEIDARGIARAIGGADELGADYALQRAVKAGLAVTADGRWFGPSRGPSRAHATKNVLTERWAVRFPDGSFASRDRDYYGIGSRAFSPSEIYAGRGDLAGAAVSSRMNALNLASFTRHGAVAVDTSTGKVEALGRSKTGHATKKGSAARLDREIAEALSRRPRHATKIASTLFALEFDPSEFDRGRDLPADAKWRPDLVDLAKQELERGRSHRRPKDARYTVIEWTGFRGALGRLLDWLEKSPGVTRYAEIFA